MVTLEQAKEMFAEMVAKSDKKYQIDGIWEISFEDPIYVMMVIDENGDQLLPGEAFPCIRKADGAIIDWHFPCPA